MRRFCKNCDDEILDTTFFESCGVADLITTCLGGRNRRIAEAHVRTGRPIAELEEELLNGQKLQGPLAAKEAYAILGQKNLLPEFPLFRTIYEIFHANTPATVLLERL